MKNLILFGRHKSEWEQRTALIQRMRFLHVICSKLYLLTYLDGHITFTVKVAFTTQRIKSNVYQSRQLNVIYTKYTKQKLWNQIRFSAFPIQVHVKY